MATTSAHESSDVGASTSELIVVNILATTRKQETWVNFDLCEISNGKKKARCKHCKTFLAAGANSTLNSHISDHCKVLKGTAKPGQSQMSKEGVIFSYGVEKVRKRMAQFVIQQETGVNLTTDVWSAPHGLPELYLCVTAHWVDQKTWQLMKSTIAFEMFGYPHTRDALFEILDEVIQTYKLEKKILSISFDNASNNTSAVQKLKINYEPICNGMFFHSRCVAHIINSVVQHGLDVPAIKKVRDVFKEMLQDVFASSKRRRKEYEKLCKDLKKP
uniref:zinc finger BED domain-containing protein RICESLEEPER 3-like n=1 Tax=Erigeron canadensis TaxID=72917 RepID=UPI001CB90CE1|nr:zinc finger BED domain-containing protein RICESLEEPER 3-like [Erigeron canadensis]